MIQATPANGQNNPKATTHECQKVSNEPLGPAWEVLKRRYPQTTLQEKIVFWMMLKLRIELKSWPRYELVVIDSLWEFTFQCPNCSSECRYEPPFAGPTQVHQVIHDLVQKRLIGCRLDSLDEYNDEALNNEEFKPEIILMVDHKDIVQEAILAECGEEAK